MSKQREIKFRAWVTGANVPYMASWETIIDSKYPLFPFDNGVIPMQYTGLKDRDGKEIYHKDVFGGIKELRGVTEQEEDGRWVVEFLDSRIPKMSITDRLIRDSEVVGNIYENPELLETN